MQNEDFTWSWCEHKLTKDGGAYACFRKTEKMVCSSFPPSKPPPTPPPMPPPMPKPPLRRASSCSRVSRSTW